MLNVKVGFECQYMERDLNVNAGMGVEWQGGLNARPYDKVEEWRNEKKSNERYDEKRLWKTLKEGETSKK